jgi:hypothetical protein
MSAGYAYADEDAQGARNSVGVDDADRHVDKDAASGGGVPPSRQDT